MSPLAQLPVTLIIAIVATIFVTLYRKHSKFYLLCWMNAWLLFLVHFVARDLRTIAAFDGSVPRTIDVFSLQAAAYCLAIAGLNSVMPMSTTVTGHDAVPSTVNDNSHSTRAWNAARRR